MTEMSPAPRTPIGAVVLVDGVPQAVDRREAGVVLRGPEAPVTLVPSAAVALVHHRDGRLYPAGPAAAEGRR